MIDDGARSTDPSLGVSARQQSSEHPDGLRLLAFVDLADKGIPFTRQYVARLIKQGRFPAPMKLGVGTNRWIASEIDSWLTQRKTERDAALAQRRGDV